MTIILPILFFAAVMGLFSRRITKIHWWVMASWIMIVISYHFLKA